jgi:hypothetical protein
VIWAQATYFLIPAPPMGPFCAAARQRPHHNCIRGQTPRHVELNVMLSEEGTDPSEREL